MTFSDFNLLSEDAQWLALNEATQLAVREEGEHTIYLFQLRDFYVEVFCHRSDYSQGHCRSFTDIGLLEPYLEKISIEVLFRG